MQIDRLNGLKKYLNDIYMITQSDCIFTVCEYICTKKIKERK
jgi:hypothetical protein